MSKKDVVMQDHFLNRIAMAEHANPWEIDPLNILKRIFESGNQHQLQKMFLQFANAAMSANYLLKDKSPANFLFTFEKLELLIEAAYLIQKRKWRKRMPTRYEAIETARLPVYLNEKEYIDPTQTLDRFFAYHPLSAWKKELYLWMEASMSDYSITDSLEPSDILPFVKSMTSLIDAAYQLRICSI